MQKRVVGIDFGLARIGVALSDPSQMIASPLTTLQAKKNMQVTVQELLLLLKDYTLEAFVVGMPYQLNGQVGSSADSVMLFIEEIKKQSDIPVKTWDERLTTQQTERMMKSNNMSRKKRMKVIDSACATLILQNYLDQKSFATLPSYDY